MIKCNLCDWQINEEYYIDDSLGIEGLLLSHAKTHNKEPKFITLDS